MNQSSDGKIANRALQAKKGVQSTSSGPFGHRARLPAIDPLLRRLWEPGQMVAVHSVSILTSQGPRA